MVNLDDYLDAPTSTWSRAAARPPFRSRRGRSRGRCPTPRSCRRSRRSPRARAPGRTSTSSPRRPPRAAIVGGAQRGKAVIVLNPADPPILMRNTVYCLVEGDCRRRGDISNRRRRWWARVQELRAGFPPRASACSSRHFTEENPLHIPETGKFWGTRVSAFLQGDRSRGPPPGVRRQPRHHDVGRARPPPNESPPIR